MLNKVMLIGRLGADPEIRYMPSGDSIATLNVATSRRWKDRNSGERKEETEWHRVTFFGPVAKVCGDYLKKGSQVYIEGRIKTDKYQKDGVDVYRTGIIGEQMNMLDSRSGGTANYSDNSPPASSHDNRQSAPAAASGPQSTPASYDDFDDDIPF
ncbi:single-stranded DNA-binding protein [Methylomonas lenta]|uniref:Single-stranded DNA-binding protein n=1 Tax=Methylomonas lenta TaxID=980561 RepID=A0A177N7P0_9GAMM|nr:single-stranded DNA-binding protein [Methylomonas lenta]OAI14056.1 single-stranded DNA-binding protein [Methylomonas lenta]